MVSICTISENANCISHLIKKDPHECDFIVHSDVLADPTELHLYRGFEESLKEGITVTDIPYCDRNYREPSDVMYIYNILKIKLLE